MFIMLLKITRLLLRFVTAAYDFFYNQMLIISKPSKDRFVCFLNVSRYLEVLRLKLIKLKMRSKYLVEACVHLDIPH